MTRVKVCCVVVTVLALPFVFQANTGCTIDAIGTGVGAQSFPNSYLCSCTCSTTTFHREFRASFSEDDAEQKLSDNTVDITSPDLDLSAARVVGVRFRNVEIPPMATIVNATVQFTASSDGTGTVMYGIKAEDSDNAAPFSATANNLLMRPVTMVFVNWGPANWPSGASGPEQRTPNLKTVLQPVVKRSQWAKGNSLVLLIATASGAGARHAVSADGRIVASPLLAVDFQEGSPAMIGPQDLPVCMAPAQNPDLNGFNSPSDADLSSDCSGRVQTTLTGLADACGYPSNCSCTFQADSRRFADKCNTDCVENTVDMNCADFDPVHGQVGATNAPGDQPVCLTNSPLAQGLFGRRTRCEVNGTATVKIDDEDPDEPPGASGILEFLGTPCPGASCPVGLEYRLDVGAVTFSSFFDSDTFDQLAGLGKNIPSHDALLSTTGDGMFMPGQVEVSARGRRDPAQLALATENASAININVKFGSMAPTCALTGALLGGLDPEAGRCDGGGDDGKICKSDGECADGADCVQEDHASFNVALDVSGDIVNQPPTADAGDDQTLECTDAAGSAVILDGTGSSDLDGNISLFSWRRGSRVGPEVGVDPISNVLQPLGAESYVLRVIDAFGQTDEDTTMVDVADTMPPELNCSVAKHVLEILNHNLVNVGLGASAVDQCEGMLPVTVKVFGDEDDQVNTGDGVFSPDAKSLSVGALRLRAERKNTGNGRVYLIVAEASDTSGNRGFDCCTVIVPRSPRLQASLQSAEMQAVAAQSFCLAHDGTAPAAYHVIGDGPVIGSKQ